MIGILVAFGCSSKKSLVEGDVDELRLGSYGGFSNAYSEKMVYRTGETFYKTKKKSRFVKGQKIQEGEADRIFENFTTFGLDKMDVKDPGSITFFIEGKIGGKKYKLEWGGKNVQLDPKLQMFYNVVKGQVKKREIQKSVDR